MSANIFIKFLLENQRGNHGLTFEESLQFQKLDKEKRHDYFQWLFPIDTISAYNKSAPILTEELIELLKRNNEAKSKMRYAFQMYCNYLFYQNKEWPAPTNHNNLRITRVLTFLNKLNLSEEADQLYHNILMKYFQGLDAGRNSLDHWGSAMFSKRLFVSMTESNYNNYSRKLKMILPDHSLCNINTNGDITRLMSLFEPILICKDSSTRRSFLTLSAAIDTLPDFSNRNTIVKIQPGDTEQLLEDYFLSVRYWY